MLVRKIQANKKALKFNNKLLITTMIIDVSRCSNEDIQKLKDNINIAIISEQWNVTSLSFDVIDD